MASLEENPGPNTTRMVFSRVIPVAPSVSLSLFCKFHQKKILKSRISSIEDIRQEFAGLSDSPFCVRGCIIIADGVSGPFQPVDRPHHLASRSEMTAARLNMKPMALLSAASGINARVLAADNHSFRSGPKSDEEEGDDRLDLRCLMFVRLSSAVPVERRWERGRVVWL